MTYVTYSGSTSRKGIERVMVFGLTSSERYPLVSYSQKNILMIPVIFTISQSRAPEVLFSSVIYAVRDRILRKIVRAFFFRLFGNNHKGHLLGKYV